MFLRPSQLCLIVALATVVGCRWEVTTTNSEAPPHEGSTPPKPAEARAIVEAWVPLGTEQSAAIQAMEHRGYKCEIEHDAHFGTERGLDYIHCTHDYTSGMIVESWQVALILTGDRVSRIEVTTALTGP